ncbi:MAG TPA: FAD-binding oxidoreductase [Longimicrobiales bacterium]|nr:FAD-binding oxidoreductase [Longimicrobiales bacterium]
MTPVLDRLRGIAGLHVSPGDEGPLVHGVMPAAVAAPETPAAAAEALRLASAERWAVELDHGGSPLRLAGRPPERIDLLLTSSRFRDLDDYAPADLTASVGAGAPLGAMAERFGVHGQWLPLDPPGGPDATIGATVDSAAAGPLRLAYGTPRDHVLGLEVVTGDGRVLHFGGRVVKNVAGYDVVKLVIGSRGTLGLVTRVNVRLRPRPEADRTLSIAVPSAEVAVEMLRRFRARRVEPAAAELYSPPMPASQDARTWVLLARVHGSTAAVDEQGRAIEQVAAELGAQPEATDGPQVWQPLAQTEALAMVAVRFADLPSEIHATLALVQAALPAIEASGGRWTLQAHLGNGIVRLLGAPDVTGPQAHPATGPSSPLLPSSLARDWRPLADTIRSARAALAPRRGTVTLAAAPAPLLAEVDPYGPIAGHALMRGIKARFDPAGILSAGRFVV